MSVEASVIEREREYHNQRFTEETRDAQEKYYFAIQDCDAEYERRLTRLAKDAVILDYGCGVGDWALKLAPQAREVQGIDISDVAIAQASERASALGLGHAHFAARDAHATGFPNDYFDLVFGIGIIHHLDTERSLAEVARVLKPGGVAVFREPLGCNPVINLYRKATPGARTEDEHPLVQADYGIASRLFRARAWDFYGLATLASVPLRSTPIGQPVYRAMALLDRLLLRTPGLRWQGWCALMQLEK
jgi:SAM-dependent methyltransferase